jgi:XisI protein
MDRLTHYQNLIKQFLREFAELVNNPPSENPEMFCLFDDEQHHYLLLNVGWEDFTCPFT